jgi:hypothetical protein
MQVVGLGGIQQIIYLPLLGRPELGGRRDGLKPRQLKRFGQFGRLSAAEDVKLSVSFGWLTTEGMR